eukprot:symbB.v1.2.036390.t1/scaffold5127.1/size30577/3
MAALFFSSSAPTPESDPKCSPPEDLFERLVRSVTVGLVTGLLGKGVIFCLFFWQTKGVVRRKQWTETNKRWQRFRWKLRTCVFWVLSFVYTAVCNIYTWLFVANVREVDAEEWMYGILGTLFQELLLFPLVMAFLFAGMSSLILCCQPELRRSDGFHTVVWIPLPLIPFLF